MRGPRFVFFRANNKAHPPAKRRGRLKPTKLRWLNVLFRRLRLFALGLLFRRHHERRAGGSLLGADGQFDLLVDLAMLLEEVLGLLASLAEARVVVREERAALRDELQRRADE